MANNKHGMYGTPTYKSWAEMKSRCKHPNRATGKYDDVSYCDRWEHFENFLDDMGIRPTGTTLDRINPYGNYEPSNCRWADSVTQSNNKRNNRFYELNGERLTLSQISRKYNISRSNLANKVYIYKMNIVDAVCCLLKKKGGMTYREQKNV